MFRTIELKFRIIEHTCQSLAQTFLLGIRTLFRGIKNNVLVSLKNIREGRRRGVSDEWVRNERERERKVP